MRDRMGQLLIDAASAFAEGANPFNSDWLSERNVTLQECQDMQEHISYAIESWVKQRDRARVAAGRILEAYR